VGVGVGTIVGVGIGGVVGKGVEVGDTGGSVGIVVCIVVGVGSAWFGVEMDATSSFDSAGDIHRTSPRDNTTSATKITTIACGRNNPDRCNIRLL
jgi:hypothetical protein